MATETKFWGIDEKIKLMAAINNKEIYTPIFDEIARLEGIIRDYEIGMRILEEKGDSKWCKHPTEVNI